MYTDKLMLHDLDDSLSKNDAVSLAHTLLQTCNRMASASISLINYAKTLNHEAK